MSCKYCNLENYTKREQCPFANREQSPILLTFLRICAIITVYNYMHHAF